jgi:hypothetical protein
MRPGHHDMQVSPIINAFLYAFSQHRGSAPIMIRTMPPLSVSLDGGMTSMQTLAYDYEYPPVVHLLGNAVAGWAIVATFLALMTVA